MYINDEKRFYEDHMTFEDNHSLYIIFDERKVEKFIQTKIYLKEFDIKIIAQSEGIKRMSFEVYPDDYLVIFLEKNKSTSKRFMNCVRIK